MRLLNALWMSFYSRPLYREVFTQWRGIGLGYLFLLAIIQTIVATAQFDGALDVVVRDYAPAIVQQIPVITLKNGEASTPENKIYQVHEANSGRLLALIDTSMETPPENMGETGMIVAKNGLVLPANPLFAEKPGQSQFFAYKKLWPAAPETQLVVDRPFLVAFLKEAATWGALFFSPIILIQKLIFLIIPVLFFSLIAWVNFRSASLPASYKAILRLTAVSFSPAVLLSIVMDVFVVGEALGSFLFVLLSVGYLTYAIQAVKNPEKEISDDEDSA